MSTTGTIYRIAGVTDALEGLITLDSSSSLSASDLTSISIDVRKKGATTNHVDGGSATVVSVASVAASDSTTQVPRYNVTVLWTFDVVGAKLGGGNALDASGTYYVQLFPLWATGETTGHPAIDADQRLTVIVLDSDAS